MKFKEVINNPKFRYIALTLVISAIGFLKSFILLKIFDSQKLGIVALSQTIITTISLLQFGAVTGGYRLFSYKREGVLKGVNSAILVFFLFLGVFVNALTVIAYFIFDPEESIYMLFLLILIGLLSLYSNWVICKLLGSKNIVILNKAQFLSAIVSLVIAISSKWFGVTAVLISLLLQPLIIIGIAYFLLPNLIPIPSYILFKKYIIKIIKLGFIPYLTSALTVFNSQVGRWIITMSLGTAILGKTFLVTLFVTLVSVFPGAVSNMFFPSIIEKFEMNMKKDLRMELNKQFIILAGYYFFVILGAVLFTETIVRFFLPKHVESISLIYAILPSLLFLHLSVPAITLFNAAKRFKNILTGSLVSVFTYLVLLMVYIYNFRPNLFGFYIIESISALFFFLYNFYYFIKINKS